MPEAVKEIAYSYLRTALHLIFYISPDQPDDKEDNRDQEKGQEDLPGNQSCRR